jgi:hypothetical protein
MWRLLLLRILTELMLLVLLCMLTERCFQVFPLPCLTEQLQGHYTIDQSTSYAYINQLCLSRVEYLDEWNVLPYQIFVLPC